MRYCPVDVDLGVNTSPFNPACFFGLPAMNDADFLETVTVVTLRIAYALKIHNIYERNIFVGHNKMKTMRNLYLVFRLSLIIT
jgi:hypothetical protein